MAQNEKELMSVSALTRELHMRTVRNLYDQYLEQAKAERSGTTRKFLCSLLQAEYEQRLLNSQQKRLKTAGFPQYKYLEDLDRNELPEGVKPRLAELESATVQRGLSMVLYGNPGTQARHI